MLNPLSLIQKIAGGFLIGALLFTFGMWRIERHQRVKADAHAAKLEAARKADRAAYEDAQRKASDLNKAQVLQIQSEQQRITANVEADLNARLERLRRELRKQGSPNQGSSSGTGTGPVPTTAEGTPDTSRVCLAPEELLRAAESEERHEQLIRWVEEQLKVKR